MGNIIPSNKTMVDQLVDEVTLSPRVEGAFRAVDRGIYYETSGDKVNPYQMQPWRDGNLHISAPFIYAKVVEALDLKPGMSFLNLGSGTGYLSTIVGLLIAPQGINHGIEVHGQVVNYAKRKLDEFLATSSAIDKFEFVEPIFVQGNCLDLNPHRLYDRVYLGAACLPQLERFMKRLIKPHGGVLIMPIRNELILYKRLAENQWEKRTLEPAVEFTFMRSQHHSEDKQLIEMPLECVPDLRRLCREAIRRQLRLKTDLMHPNLLNSDNVERRRHRRSIAMKRAEERYLKQSRLQSNAKSKSNSLLRQPPVTCPAHCGHEVHSRLSCRQKRLVPRAGPGNRIMTRQATRQVQSGIWARDMAGGTSSSSHADLISDLDGNTERNDEDDEDDDSEIAFLTSGTSMRGPHQPRVVPIPQPSQPTSSRAIANVTQEPNQMSSSSSQSAIARTQNLASRESLVSAPRDRFDLEQILMDPILRSSIRRSRFFCPTLDGVRTAQFRLNQSVQDRNDQERIESALWHLMHRANRWRSPSPGRQLESDRGSSNSAVDDFWANPMNRARHQQEEELDRVLLALYWTKFLKLALGDGSDQDEDDDDDEDFLLSNRESSADSMNHSSSLSSPSSLDSDCQSSSSSLSTSSFASSDNEDCDAQVDRVAPSPAQIIEEPVASRLRSKRFHLNNEHPANLPSSSSFQADPIAKRSNFTRPSRSTSTRSQYCKRHQCCRRRIDACHRLTGQRAHQGQDHHQLTYSRRGELEPYAGRRHLSPAFIGSSANLSIERRILLASGFNLHRTGASLSLVNASRSVQQEMRQPMLFMNAIARSSENWSAPSWESINLCHCIDTLRTSDHLRSSSQQRLPETPARSSRPLSYRAVASMSDRQCHEQLGHLGLIGCKRKRRTSESNSSDHDDDDYHGSPSEFPNCSRRCLQRSRRPLFHNHAIAGSQSSARGNSTELSSSARRRVCSQDSSSDLMSSSSSVQGVAHRVLNDQTTTSCRGYDSIKSTNDNERLRTLAAKSVPSRSTSGAALATNIDDGQQRPGAPPGRQACRQHHHHCRHHHRHHHHHHTHCRHHQRALSTSAMVSCKRRRGGHHCRRHRQCWQRHGRQTNHQAPGERPADFHVRRRVERERRQAAVQNGRSSSARRPSRRPGNECEKYRSHISSYIRQLDLPAALLDYLNYDREFE